MLNFTPLALTDIPEVRAALHAHSNSLICDRSVGALFMWRRHFGTCKAFVNGGVVFKYHNSEGETCFSEPVTPNGMADIGLALDYCRASGIAPVFAGLTETMVTELKRRVAVTSVASNRDYSDYLYNAADLGSFAGRRFNGQRNHVNKFAKTHPNAVFEELTADNLPLVPPFIERYNSERGAVHAMQLEERGILAEIYGSWSNYEAYGFVGGILRAEPCGDVLGVTSGSVNGSLLVTHTEKADITVQGAYQTVVKRFAALCAEKHGVTLINREEDLGLPGLRTSKLSYHPVEVVDKYTVRCETPV